MQVAYCNQIMLEILRVKNSPRVFSKPRVRLQGLFANEAPLMYNATKTLPELKHNPRFGKSPCKSMNGI